MTPNLCIKSMERDIVVHTLEGARFHVCSVRPLYLKYTRKKIKDTTKMVKKQNLSNWRASRSIYLPSVSFFRGLKSMGYKALRECFWVEVQCRFKGLKLLKFNFMI